MIKNCNEPSLRINETPVILFPVRQPFSNDLLKPFLIAGTKLSGIFVPVVISENSTVWYFSAGNGFWL